MVKPLILKIIGPVHNSPTDIFDDFDDEEGQNLIGSLHLDNDEEPMRRGASRANSVRFDVSALQGSHWAQGSRSPGEPGPIRPSSGFGSHPMTERSLSHKSDGRHSSAGHSVHSIHSVPSGRTSSLGLDTNFMIGDPDGDSPLDQPDPPPGLFILGSVPSIIRCWLTVNFSHSALIYADICTGSQKSVIDYSLVKELGLTSQMEKDAAKGRYMIRLPVYLPEAVITQSSSRSNSPGPQLPTLTVNFEVLGQNPRSASDNRKSIRVFVGSDTLRAHNADILFSQNLMTLFGDDRSKLSIPFVRPENELLFKNLCITNIAPEKNELKATALPFTPSERKPKTSTSDVVDGSRGEYIQPGTSEIRSDGVTKSQINSTIATPKTDNSTKGNENISDSEKQYTLDEGIHTANKLESPDTIGTLKHELPAVPWGSWRQGGTPLTSDHNGGSTNGSRGGRSMKVLKPSKPISSLSTLGASRSSPGARFDSMPARSMADHKRNDHSNGIEKPPLRWEPKKPVADDQKSNGAKVIATLPRPSNPVGGASAFAWMNSNSKANGAAIPTSTPTAGES